MALPVSLYALARGLEGAKTPGSRLPAFTYGCQLYVSTVQKFEVHVLEGPEAQVKTVTVLVDVTQKKAKAYRGGYKDKRNGTLYHNADCQTDRKVWMHGKSCAQRDLNIMHIPVHLVTVSSAYGV